MAERLQQQLLARRGRQQVVAADHVRHAVVQVVERVRELVGGDAVGAQQHVVAEQAVLPLHGAPHQILDLGHALERRAEPDHRLAAGRLELRDLGGRQVAMGARRRRRIVGLARRRAGRLELLRRLEAGIREAVGDQLRRDLAVHVEALALQVRAERAALGGRLVEVEPEPVERLLDLLDRAGRLAGLVGVLDAQHRDAAVVAGEQPVVEGGANASDVEVPGRRGAEADPDIHRRPIVRGRCSTARTSRWQEGSRTRSRAASTSAATRSRSSRRARGSGSRRTTTRPRSLEFGPMAAEAGISLRHLPRDLLHQPGVDGRRDLPEVGRRAHEHRRASRRRSAPTSASTSARTAATGWRPRCRASRPDSRLRSRCSPPTPGCCSRTPPAPATPSAATSASSPP